MPIATDLMQFSNGISSLSVAIFLVNFIFSNTNFKHLRTKYISIVLPYKHAKLQQCNCNNNSFLIMLTLVSV